MKLYIDQDTKKLITEATSKVSVKNLSFKKDDSSLLEVIFVSTKTEQPALSTRSINLGIKSAGDYNGDFLVQNLSADSLSGTSYNLFTSFDTSNLNALLSANETSVSTMLEIAWSDDGGIKWQAADTVPTTISNCVIQRS